MACVVALEIVGMKTWIWTDAPSGAHRICRRKNSSAGLPGGARLRCRFFPALQALLQQQFDLFAQEIDVQTWLSRFIATSAPRRLYQKRNGPFWTLFWLMWMFIPALVYHCFEHPMAQKSVVHRAGGHYLLHLNS